MTVLTSTALLGLIAAQHCVPPELAPVMVAIAQWESGLNTDAINHNKNGTIDVGLAQVNTANFSWLGLTMQTARDPCININAGARVLLAKYNGASSGRMQATYAAGVLAQMTHADKLPGPSPPPDPCPPSDPDGWHTVPHASSCPPEGETDHDPEKQ